MSTSIGLDVAVAPGRQCALAIAPLAVMAMTGIMA
jgi:hypothetical protein